MSTSPIFTTLRISVGGNSLISTFKAPSIFIWTPLHIWSLTIRSEAVTPRNRERFEERTHVKNTSEIGGIEIYKIENKGKNNKRMYFLNS